MATENKPTPDEANYVVQRGTKTDLGNGQTRHVGRHPQNPDHKITIVTASVNNKPHIIKAYRELMPMQEIVDASKKRSAETKARKDRSAAAQAAQLAKKRARTPAPNNKKK
jgi:hypothetical protein